MHRCHVQAQLFRCFMLQEVEGSSANAIMIYINGTTLRFTRRDFCLVSGLKCSDDLSEFVFNTEEQNRLLQMYFPEKKSVSKAEFAQSFNNKVWGDNADDALKFGILYFIHSYILSEEPFSTIIEQIDFDLVESGMYMDYPWGNKAFEELTKNINGKMKKKEKYYRIYGFPIAMQVWFYECCSQVDKNIAVKKSDHIPRILSWVTKRDYPRIEYFMKGMFCDVNNPVCFFAYF
uniref:Ulp1 protease family, C-terminal catalytic domain containing protein n=1 Tax=Solanum tuberosum TaxID=4113 RepID=M1DYU0_SOLTU